MKPNGIAGLARLLGKDTRTNASHWKMKAYSGIKVEGAVCMENTETRDEAFVAPIANRGKKH
jgi:hypothetical protein